MFQPTPTILIFDPKYRSGVSEKCRQRLEEQSIKESKVSVRAYVRVRVGGSMLVALKIVQWSHVL